MCEEHYGHGEHIYIEVSDASYSTSAGDEASVLQCNIPDRPQIVNLS
jgi:hypothetical protein